MISPADIGHSINLPPKEAVRYLEAKNVVVTQGWRTLRDEQHARAATVANVSKADVVSDIYAELGRTLRSGGTFEQWKDNVIPRLQAKGWWKPDGPQPALAKAGYVDQATGEIRKALTPSRLKTIFATNMQSAYMAGRYRQMMSMASEAPYWQYVAILDSRTRPAHRAMNGKIFKYDDPAWGAVFPPNGYRCRCRVRNFTQSEVTQRGMTVDSSAGKLSRVEVPQADGSTMTVTRYSDKSLPSGHFQPDAGFDHASGARFPRLDKNRVVDSITPAAPKVQGLVVKEAVGQTTWKDLNLPDLRSIKPDMPAAPALLARADSRMAAAEMVIAELGLKDTPWRRVDTPVGTELLRRDYIEHVVEKGPEARERFAKFILPTLTDPYEVWLTMYDDGRPRKRFIGLYKGAQYDVLVVCRQNTDGSIFWNMMPAEAKKLNQQRVGKLLWGK
jgi:SPP1 gp7 family putative phage head morphogenesis protein